MARELRDVLHYFLEAPPAEPRGGRQAVLAIPVAQDDLLQGAFLWNLAAELARDGSDVAVVAPAARDPGPLWAELGRGGGVRYVPAFAGGLPELAAAVQEVAEGPPGPRSPDRLVLVETPEEWIENGGESCNREALFAWSLLFTTPELSELRRALGRAERLARSHPDARLGVTVHGVRHLEEAREAFLRLARAAEPRLGRPLVSYGLLLDDLDVYRALVDQRAVGCAHPQSRAARALRDVARLIREDLAPADA